jgi:hypothetical protein
MKVNSGVELETKTPEKIERLTNSDDTSKLARLFFKF